MLLDREIDGAGSCRSFVTDFASYALEEPPISNQEATTRPFFNNVWTSTEDHACAAYQCYLPVLTIRAAGELLLYILNVAQSASILSLQELQSQQKGDRRSDWTSC